MVAFLLVVVVVAIMDLVVDVVEVVVKAMVEKKVGSETGSVRFFFKWRFIFFSLGVVKVSNLGFWSKF